MSGMPVPVRLIARRRWACKEGDCGQYRYTPADSNTAPICGSHGKPMAKGRKVFRRRSARTPVRGVSR